MIYVFEAGNMVYDSKYLSEKQKSQAIRIEALPEKATPSGKRAVLVADKKTESVWWDYVDDAEIVVLSDELAKAYKMLIEAKLQKAEDIPARVRSLIELDEKGTMATESEGV